MSGASAVGAFRTGLRKLVDARRYLLLAYAWNLVLAVCLGVMVDDAIRTSLGSSLAGDRMRAGWDSLWYYSFSAQASPTAWIMCPPTVIDGGSTFTPSGGHPPRSSPVRPRTSSSHG